MHSSSNRRTTTGRTGWPTIRKDSLITYSNGIAANDCCLSYRISGPGLQRANRPMLFQARWLREFLLCCLLVNTLPTSVSANSSSNYLRLSSVSTLFTQLMDRFVGAQNIIFDRLLIQRRVALLH